MDAFFEAIFSHIGKEWALVTGAPFLTAFAILVIGAAAWVVQGMIHDTRHATHKSTVEQKDAHIGFLTGQLAEYKAQLHGATPGEAAKEIADLRDVLTNTRAQMDMMARGWQHFTSQRRMTEDQKKLFTDSLVAMKPEHKVSLLVASIADPEAQQYALEILACMKAAGMCPHQAEPAFGYTTSPDERGVLVIVQNDLAPHPCAVDMLDAFRKANIDARLDTPTSGAVMHFHCVVMVSHKPSLSS